MNRPGPIPIRVNIKNLIDRGLSRDDIADHFKVSTVTLRKWMKCYELKIPMPVIRNVRLSNDDVRLIRLMAEAGMKIETIRSKFDDRERKPATSTIYDVVAYKTYTRIQENR